MKVLFYRYGSICEPDIIDAFHELGHQVTELNNEVTNKNLYPKDIIHIVGDFLMDHPQDFVFTVNFFPMISEVCNIFKIPYLCWSVDSPVMELYSKSIQNPYNRVFLFDRAQYNEIHALNPSCVFHLPLAANVSAKQAVIASASTEDTKRFTHDLSFVGSLYTEKCPYDKLTGASDYLNGYLDGIMKAQMKVYGYYFIEDLLDSSVVEEFRAHLPGFYTYPMETFLTDKITMSQLYVGNKISAMERLDTMEHLCKRFPVDIYTGSDTSQFKTICNHGFAKSLTEMPIIFHQSKINLNITSKPIRSGLPLRIWDILSCNGFVLTNYQEELPDYFEIGTDLDAYGSIDELMEKVDFYLHHENIRAEIAQNGYEKLKKYHTYPIRMEEMLRLAFPNK